MKYSIPERKLEKLSKIINRYNKKGANITFNIGEKVVENGTLFVEDPFTHTCHTYNIKVNCVEVFVEGTYKINDWSFVGTIEFTTNGNIIRLANSSFEGKVPSKYLHTPKICEHCGKIRNRKDTYLIYNEKTNEFKQVGSTCLLDYTKGLDADECASIMSCMDQVKNLCDYTCNGEGFFGSSSSSCGIGEDIKNYAIALVKAKGYQKMENGKGSARDLSAFYFPHMRDENWEREFGSLTLASNDEVKAINEYAQQYIDSSNMYMRNASLAWLKGCVEYRDFGLICAFVNTYLKEVLKKVSSDRNNEFVGKIGDRITIKVASYRCLFSSSYEVAWHTWANSYTYEIIDEEGHTFIWKSSKDFDLCDVTLKNGNYCRQEFCKCKVKEIVATIVSHDDYKGIKQTKLSRGKITQRELIDTFHLAPFTVDDIVEIN